MIIRHQSSHGAARAHTALAVHARKSVVKGVGLFLLDATLYALALSGVIFSDQVWVRLASSVALGLLTSLLFVVGHDACHNSLTPSRRLNEVVGRLAFLPSLHTFSLWNLGHNRTHHRYTNLKGYDYVFAPLTKAEYDGLKPPRRAVERLYRSVWGQGIYYFYEIWWKRMFFPSRTVIAESKIIYMVDSLLVACWMGFLLILSLTLSHSIALAKNSTALPWWEIIILVVALPQVIWNWLMGFVIYQHHTHPRVGWFSDYEEWAASRAQLHSTVHVVFPKPIGLVLHNIMEHTAHHAHVQIPLYKLSGAQTSLEHRFPNDVVIQKWSLKNYLDTAAQCKLYDYNQHEWLDFSGRPSAD